MRDGVARMGQIVFSDNEITELKVLGLGSCIGLCIYEHTKKLGCLAHIVWPEAESASASEAGKYANTAVPRIVKDMVAKGANVNLLKAVIAGGAHLFESNGIGDYLDIGKRNIAAVKSQLSKFKIELVAEDVGGKHGRTMIFNVETGHVLIKQAGGTPKILARLGG
ncbi:MAG: chemotaxis protein CheD [Armatimonadota bacterium]